MSQELLEQQLQRLEGLLNPERTKVVLEKTDPEYSPQDLGALAGVGYLARNPDVRISVYVFGDWSKHREIAKQLRSGIADPAVVYARTATNGPMLFFAQTRLDSVYGDDAEFRLDRIMSAFAGDE